MSNIGNFVVEVQEYVGTLISAGVDVDRVYELVKLRYGEMGVALVADCYFGVP